MKKVGVFNQKSNSYALLALFVIVAMSLSMDVKAGCGCNPVTMLQNYNPIELLASINPGYGDSSDNLSSVRSVNFSPCGRYLAVGASSGFDTDRSLELYAFNPAGSEILTRIASINPGDGNSPSDNLSRVWSVNFSPCGRYLAVGVTSGDPTGRSLELYAFNPAGYEVLTRIASINPGYGNSPSDNLFSVQSVNFSPCGRYLAVGAVSGNTGRSLELYAFNPAGDEILTRIASINPGYGDSSDNLSSVVSVNFSPCGRYLAVGALSLGNTGRSLELYAFNPAGSEILTRIASINPGDGNSPSDNLFSVQSVNFSPCGRYLAVGAYSGLDTDSRSLELYAFNYQDFMNFSVSVDQFFQNNSPYVLGATFSALKTAGYGPDVDNWISQMLNMASGYLTPEHTGDTISQFLAFERAR